MIWSLNTHNERLFLPRVKQVRVSVVTYAWRNLFIVDVMVLLLVIVTGIRRWAMRVRERREAKFMHHPIGFDSFSSSTTVEHKRLLQTDALSGVQWVYRPVSSGCFPESTSSYSVRPSAVSIFPVSWTVKVPLFLPHRCKLFLNIDSRKCIQGFSLHKFGEKLEIRVHCGLLGRSHGSYL